MLTKRALLNHVLLRPFCSGRNNMFLSMDDLPTPKGLPFVGTVLSFMAAGSSSRLHKYIDNRHRELGSIFRENVGQVDAVFISDPNIMRSVLTRLEGKYPLHILPEPWVIYNKKYECERGLFFMDGEEWLHYRKIMNKCLLQSNTEAWMDAPIEAVANNLIKKWKKQCTSTGFQPDLESELYRVSLDVLLSVVLGSAYKSNVQTFNELLAQFAEKVHKVFLYTSKMYILPATFYSKFNLPVWIGFVNSIQDSLRLGKQLVEQAYTLENKGDGLLSKMIEMELNQTEITRILTDFVIAAGDTTSFTTQWTLYLLSKNPDVVAKYRKMEINSIEEEKYMRGIIKESMRIYPVAPFLTRILPDEHNLNGCIFPAGTIMVLSIYTSGRSSRYFTDPFNFTPERWDRNKMKTDTIMTPHASMPFAIGTRSCIGQKIAMMQMRQIIDKIIRNFDIQLLNKNGVDDHMQMVLKPRNKIKIACVPI